MSDQTFIIAEAGVNHNGDQQRALEMIEVAAQAGANAIKFQTFIPELLTTSSADKADYQKQNDGDQNSQLEMLQKLALDFEAHHILVKHCDKHDIQFLSSPFDLQSADFLIQGLKLDLIKLGSGELTNAPLLFKIASEKKQLILSTGMASLDEIEDTLAILAFGYLNKHAPENLQQARNFYQDTAQAKQVLQSHVSLLHCTTSYPCPTDQVNLRAMLTLSESFGLPTGYSDHTEGLTVSTAAVALGAKIIEKHFTLDRSLPGPDHKASLEPNELQQLVTQIREVESALGSAEKKITSTEEKNKAAARKSLVTRAPIQQGESYTEDNLTCKRPGHGISPMLYWNMLGKQANRDYREDEVIKP